MHYSKKASDRGRSFVLFFGGRSTRTPFAHKSQLSAKLFCFGTTTTVPQSCLLTLLRLKLTRLSREVRHFLKYFDSITLSQCCQLENFIGEFNHNVVGTTDVSVLFLKVPLSKLIRYRSQVMNCTVWKFKSFSAILREINFGELGSSKTPVLTILVPMIIGVSKLSQ